MFQIAIVDFLCVEWLVPEPGNARVRTVIISLSIVEFGINYTEIREDLSSSGGNGLVHSPKLTAMLQLQFNHFEQLVVQSMSIQKHSRLS